MSALLTETSRALGGASGSAAVRTAVGAIVIAVLLLILVAQEMARAELSEERARRISHLRLVTVPLTLVFVGVVVPRIADLLR
jgi:heme/copper-type cytochrome/quinol oxidase subunit 3